MADVVESALRESRDLLAEHWFPDDRAERREKDAALARFDAAIETLRARLCGVVVRPLKWRDYDSGDAWADSGVGLVYCATKGGAWMLRNGAPVDAGADVSAAKAAAQADYEARILSALTPSPSAGAGLIAEHLTPDFVDDSNCCAGKLATPPATPVQPTASVGAVAKAIAREMHKGGDFGLDGDSAYASRPAEFLALARAALASLTPAPTQGDGA